MFATRRRARPYLGRKFVRASCLGFYHDGTSTEAPFILIVVDSCFACIPRWLCWSSLVCDLALAKTVYHEVGHHLDATIGSHARAGERAADDWAARLGRAYFARRYRVQRWIFRKLKLMAERLFRTQIAEARAEMRLALQRQGGGPRR